MKIVSVSVVLCTFNGERFLSEQIESILSQTYPVDEIIISDDCSEDGTRQVINDYYIAYPKLVRPVFRSVNIGAKENFMHTLKEAKGDIVFLSDQDDIWEKEKVWEVFNYFQEHPNIGCVFTDGSIIQDTPDNIIGSLFHKLKFHNDTQARWSESSGFILEDLFYPKYYVTGATMALKNDLIKDMPAISFSQQIWHDAFIAMYAAACNSLGFIAKPLIKYRLHHNQQVGLSNINKTSNSLYARDVLDRAHSFYRGYATIADILMKSKFVIMENKNVLSCISNEKHHIADFYRFRLDCMKLNIFVRTKNVFSFLSIYLKQKNGFYKILKDLLSPIH